MKGLAFISFQGGGLVLPARTPYERELLFQHLKQCANRYGQVRLAFNRLEWTIRLMSGPSVPCAVCDKMIDSVLYERGGQGLCVTCATRAMR